VIVGRAFVENPDLAVGALSLGMGDGARRAMQLGFRAFAPYYRMRHRINPDTIAEAPRKVMAAMDRIVAELQPSGYLVGDRFTVADLTAASFLSILAQPPELQYRPAEPVLGAISDVSREFLAHQAIDWTREMYRRHRGKSAELAPSAAQRAVQ
jgi:glutathione S-transferase